MDAVFLDTNAVRNPDLNSFFGNSSRFQQMSRLAKIVIPSIVIEEIKWQKKEKAIRDLDSFKSNYFSKLVDYNYNEFRAHIDSRIDELFNNSQSELKYSEQPLRDDPSHLNNLRGLAIQKQPPFDAGTDKGFKDACIFLTINQFLEENSGSIFLFSNDGRLKEAFEKNERVNILKEAEEFFNLRKSYFSEDYFLESLANDFNQRISDGEPLGLFIEVEQKDISVKAARLNDEDDWIVGITVSDKKFELTVDYYSKEITWVERL